VPGNLHDIGALMVSGQFERAGWRAMFLGASTPAQELARAAKAFEVDVVALSVGLALNVRGTADAIRLLREARPELPILVGGLPFQAIPDLWRDVGADGTAADGEVAVQLASRLLDERS
jgi:methanogenic corrinoid protein MtbC1